MSKRILLSSPHFTGGDLIHIKEIFNFHSTVSLDSNLYDFEKAICSYSGTNSCAALSSGTAAIHLALILLGVEPGDEVICSTFTFSASVNPICYLGASPVLIDSERDTWNMSPELLEKAISDRIKKGKKPKAIILVHLYGMPSKIDEIIDISERYSIPIIEDAAEAMGSTYKGKIVGTIGKIGIYSFNNNKIITALGGGALISNKSEYCKKAVFLATQARDKAVHYQHSQIGYNYRMSNIIAGIALGQLKVLKDRVDARRRNFDFYKKELVDMPKISFIIEPEGFCANRWLTTMLTNSFETREKIRLGIEKENIESRPLWKPMHLQPIFKEFPKYIDGTSEDLFKRGLCLPSGSNLTKEDLERVVFHVKSNIN